MELEEVRPIATGYLNTYIQLPIKEQLVAKSIASGAKLHTQSSLEYSSGGCHQGSRSNAYQRRNVYKSIIRHMHKYFKENYQDIIRILKNNGFEKDEIEKTYVVIKRISEQERFKGTPKKPKRTLSTMISNKNIYVYILKETLSQMLNQWEVEKDSKVLQKNLQIYKTVCHKYYNKCIGLLSKPNLSNIRIL
jgi:hypothetical protein